MSKNDDLFSLSAEKYLARYKILVYLEDAISQLLEHKEDNPKVNPTKFFSEYFTSVREGNHTLFREYAYINATPHNRASFVRTFWKCFRHIGKKGDLLSIREYHSLLGLLCSNFPFEPVQKTARIVLMDDAQDCLISFTDFLFAFQAQFYYDEFLLKCSDIYKNVLESPKSPRETVVVPSTDQDSPDGSTVHQTNNTSSSEGVDSMQFFWALVPVCATFEHSTPPIDVLKEILVAAPRVTFYGFLMAIAKSESINKSIGKLPCKAELFDVTDQELTSTDEKQSESISTRAISTNHRPASASSSRPPAVPNSQSQDSKSKPPIATHRKTRPVRTSTQNSSSSAHNVKYQSDSDDSDDSSSGSSTN